MLSLLSAAVAGASPCEDVLVALDADIPLAEIVRAIEAYPVAPADLSCLRDAHAPRSVVRAAARGAAAPIPPESRARWELGVDAGLLTTPPGEITEVYTLGLRGAWLATDRVAVEIGGWVTPANRSHQVFILYDTPPRPFFSLSERVPLDVRGHVDATLQLAPIDGSVWIDGARWRLHGALALGSAAITTHDDLAALNKEDDPAAQATARQTHPALRWGGVLRLSPPLGPQLRLSLTQSRWIEVSEGIFTESRQLLSAQLGATARLR